jgi:hypothetical protein
MVKQAMKPNATHYHYMLNSDELPVIFGVRDVVKGMDEAMTRSGDLAHGESADYFSVEVIRALHDHQVRWVKYIDNAPDALLDRCPAGAHLIITADHGECFEEGNYSGLGPVLHMRLCEAPFLEGRKP